LDRPVVSIIGAGVAGLACATELAERGIAIEVLERGGRVGESACSWMAGGMLAPWPDLRGVRGEMLVLRCPEVNADPHRAPAASAHTTIYCAVAGTAST
jgi:glycine oxidase